MACQGLASCFGIFSWLGCGDLFGWNAMPFALDDLDSNLELLSDQLHLFHERFIIYTLVSIVGEDCIFSQRSYLPTTMAEHTELKGDFSVIDLVEK